MRLKNVRGTLARFTHPSKAKPFIPLHTNGVGTFFGGSLPQLDYVLRTPILRAYAAIPSATLS